MLDLVVLLLSSSNKDLTQRQMFLAITGFVRFASRSAALAQPKNFEKLACSIASSFWYSFGTRESQLSSDPVQKAFPSFIAMFGLLSFTFCIQSSTCFFLLKMSSALSSSTDVALLIWHRQRPSRAQRAVRKGREVGGTTNADPTRRPTGKENHMTAREAGIQLYSISQFRQDCEEKRRFVINDTVRNA